MPADELNTKHYCYRGESPTELLECGRGWTGNATQTLLNFMGYGQILNELYSLLLCCQLLLWLVLTYLV